MAYSICIPIYQYSVQILVKNLEEQALALGLPFEILLVDDASPDAAITLNNSHLQNKNIRYIDLSENIGRSRIRNYLAQEARYDWLIYMDCDSALIDGQYLARFVAGFEKLALYCGGTAYAKELSDVKFSLRYHYGQQRESLNASQRNVDPYRFFFSNNFAVPKAWLLEYPFDVSLRQYGYEDTMFSLNFKNHNLPIIHIDNPLIHIGLDTNLSFLQKTTQAMQNLANLYLSGKLPDSLHQQITVLRYYLTLQKYQLHRLLPLVSYFLHPLLIRQLNSKKPLLWFFDIYKLLELDKMMKQS